MDKIWLKSYPPGVPAEIDATRYSSVAELLEEYLGPAYFRNEMVEAEPQVGNVTGLDLTLEVGNSTQTVDVNAAAPILKTEQSSTSAEVSVDAYAEHFPGMRPVPMDQVVDHYLRCVEGNDTGRIIRAYG